MNPGFFVDRDLLHLAVTMMAPLILAAIGEVITERSGILNLSIEGTVLLGAVTGFLGTFFTGHLAAGMAAAMLAYYAITLRRDQITVGLTLFVFTVGLSSFLYRIAVGVQFVPQRIPTLPRMTLPVLGDIPGIGPIVFSQHLLVYVALVLVVVVHLALTHTPLGLRLQAAGENPRAADAIGINIFALRYGAAVLGGMLIGLGGATLPMTITGTFTEGMSAGRGWIALMLVIFGRWRPFSILGGAFLFAYVEALQFRLALAAPAIPTQFLLMLPYVFAIIVLIRVFRGAAAPGALGRAYDREARS